MAATSAGYLRHLSRTASRLFALILILALCLSVIVLSTGYSACTGFYGPNNGHDRSIVAHPMKKMCIDFLCIRNAEFCH